jgi:hypothetical protein
MHVFRKVHEIVSLIQVKWRPRIWDMSFASVPLAFVLTGSAVSSYGKLNAAIAAIRCEAS